MSQSSGANKNPAFRPCRARVERGKRSRNGCSTCLSKKVKCDETRPHCARCVRLHLVCEWPAPRPSLASRRRGFGPIKTRDTGLWSPSSIMPREDDRASIGQTDDALTPVMQTSLPSPSVEDMLRSGYIITGSSGHSMATDENSLFLPPCNNTWQWVSPAVGSSLAETLLSGARTPANDRGSVDDPLNADSFELLRASMMGALLTATDLSFAYSTGANRALGSDDMQAVMFHCKVLAPLRSTRNWSCSAHTIFLNKAYNRDMALHFLLAVAHSELAIHYGQGPQAPQESREHFARGSQLLLQAHNPFASPDHVNMMLSFLYMYMFWMRRGHLDPSKLRDLSRAVLVYVRTCGLDTLCASDEFLSSEGASDGVINVSEQVLLARIITYLYDRDGFCCFFGCGGQFADYMNSIPQKRQRIWLRSRAAFFLPLSEVGYHEAGTEMEDAATLDVYFELLILHHENNSYSKASATQPTAVKSRLQRRLETIHSDQAALFHQVADQTHGSQCTLMTYVTATIFYALQIYFYRARQSSFGTRPIPFELQHALNSLVSAAYYATKAGQVQLLERFQWSLFIAGLEITDPVHQEWVGNTISDPAIREGFDCIRRIKQHSPASITMQKIRSLIDEVSPPTPGSAPHASINLANDMAPFNDYPRYQGVMILPTGKDRRHDKFSALSRLSLAPRVYLVPPQFFVYIKEHPSVPTVYHEQRHKGLSSTTMENNTIHTSGGVEEKKKNQSKMTADKEYGVTETLGSQGEKKLVRKIDL
ncbi:hypothetical protein BDW75DRAFT_230853 [Aspergillus navahoensis]